ncbi:pilus assembly protein Flp/PilA [Duganella sp. 1224]|uniref:Flp family type IVb pilin n=1 Tax=Duganella sp. 1224 TaxID=2587052 RepID=UPI0015CEDB65|nr:Flp family type IVb pilin [Duganella sp. 1224]NYE61662.1 pilus assembly protein Flp/PilA [Duganella sp. 1224]
MHALHQFLHDEDGVTAIEYALMGAALAAAVTAGVILLGPKLGDALSYIASFLKTA